MSFRILFSLTVIFIISCKNTSIISSQESDFIIKQELLQEAQFEQNRIFLNVSASNGEKARFYTDTGGGKVIYPTAITKLRLTIDSLREGDRIMEAVHLVNFLKEQNLPPTLGSQFLFRGKQHFQENTDGMLGANWFADKIWHFDYQNKKLYWVEEWDSKKVDQQYLTNLGFMKNSQGKHSTHFPRIPIVVEGDTIQTLFDTGAMATLSESAKSEIGNHDAIGASFIVASFFDKWKNEHPEWKIIEGGDALLKEDLIEVPAVTIGGYTIGPVWFARRKEENFTKFMSQWMDQTIHGAVGGSCFQYFNTIVVDYKKELAYFRK